MMFSPIIKPFTQNLIHPQIDLYTAVCGNLPPSILG